MEAFLLFLAALVYGLYLLPDAEPADSHQFEPKILMKSGFSCNLHSWISSEGSMRCSGCGKVAGMAKA